MKKLAFILILSAFITSVNSQVTRYWVGGGTAYGNNQYKWSLTSGGTPIGGPNPIAWQVNDIAVFDANSGSNIVVIINAIGTIGKIQVYGYQTVTVRPDDVDDRVLTLATTTGNAFYLETGSTFIIKGFNAATDTYLHIDMGSNTTAAIYGYLKVSDDDTGYGEFTKSSSAVINFFSGSTYEHNSKDALSDIPVASWNSGSTCKITGVTGSLPTNYDQSFHHFVWDCASQTSDLDFNGNLTLINGNFTMANTNGRILGLSATATVETTINGSFIQTGGKFALARSTADNTLNINGNFELSGGYFYMSVSDGAHSIVNLKGNMTLYSGAYFQTSSGTTAYTNFNFTGNGLQSFINTGVILYYKTHFTVASPAILDLGGYVLGHYQYTTGNFTLSSGAGLKTQYSTGIRTEYDQGCIQTSGTKSFNTGASYTFYTSGNQSSGNALPSTVANLTIGSIAGHTHLTLNNPSASVTIPNAGKLTIIADATDYSTLAATGGVTYNTGSSLEYYGYSSQPTTNVEFPAHPNGPGNLIINNSVSVVLNGNKTVKNDLSLTLGQLVLNGYTLTLQRLINKTGGGLTGGTTSSVIIEGGANSASLPGVTNGLANLTINRASATISLTGNINVTGTMTMTAGSFALNGGVLSYGSSATLKYNNGSSNQNCSSAEFPSTSGPYTLEIQSGATVSLHASRTLNGPLNLYLGIFSLGNNTLTLNNVLNKTEGSLKGGALSNINIEGGAVNSDLPAVADGLQDLTINRSATITLTGNVNVTGTMSLINGSFALGDGVLSYGASGILRYNKAVPLTTTSAEFPSLNGPYALQIMNADYVSLHDTRSLNGPLTLVAGEFRIGDNTLSLGDMINSVFGSLKGGSLSNLVLQGGAVTTDLPGIADGLQNLTINRPATVYLTGGLNITGTMTMTSGTLALNGGVLTYGASGKLKYNGSSAQTTSPAEFPTVNGPYIFEIQSTSTVFLHESRSLYGPLNLLTGTLSLGGFTLTLYNMITSTPAGGMTGDVVSHLIVGEYDSPALIPLASIGSLTINRIAGVGLSGPVALLGTLNLQNGDLSIGSQTLTLAGQINYVSGQLIGGPSSNITFIGAFETTYLKAIELQNLSLFRIDGQIFMDGDIQVRQFLNLQNGSLYIGPHLLTIYDFINIFEGVLIGGTASDLRFADGGDVSPGFLPAVELNDLIIDRLTGIMMAGDVVIHGDVLMNTGPLMVNAHHLSLNGPALTIFPEFLITTPSSSLSFGGIENDVFIPGTIHDLNNLYISNPNGVDLLENINIAGEAVVDGYLQTGVSQVMGPGNFTVNHTGKLVTGHPEGISNCIVVSGTTWFSSQATYGFDGTTDQLTNFPEFSEPGNLERLVVSNSNSGSVRLNNDITILTMLILQPGSKLEILPNYTLTSSGTTMLTGENCLKISADATGAGSFIGNEMQYIGDGSAEAEFFISQERWHDVSSPVTNAVSAVFLDLYLAEFSEPDSLWNFIVPVDFPLNVGKGFACWSLPLTGDRTISYSGILNTGDIPIALSATDRDETGTIGINEGWTLAGNPYPSAIDWDLVPPENMQNLDPTVYVFDGSQYLSYPYQVGFGQLEDGIIPAQQAFFIKASDFDPQLTLPQSSRVHGFSPYKSNESFANLLDIKVNGNNYKDEIFIHLEAGATWMYDTGKDAYKLFGIVEAPQLYVMAETCNLSICVLPDQNDEMVIPLGFKVGAAGIYTFDFTGMETFASPEQIYIEDLMENEMISLTETSMMSIYATPIDPVFRFNILLNHTTGLDESVPSNPLIYFSNHSIQVAITGNEKGEIHLYSLSGQLISEMKYSSPGNYCLDMTGKKGCFAVEVTTNAIRYCRKVTVY